MIRQEDFDYDEYSKWYKDSVEKAKLEGLPLRHFKHIAGNLLFAINCSNKSRKTPDEKYIRAIIEYRDLISRNERFRIGEFSTSDGFFPDIKDSGDRTSADYVMDSKKRL
jgi:hypothetical protein